MTMADTLEASIESALKLLRTREHIELTIDDDNQVNIPYVTLVYQPGTTKEMLLEQAAKHGLVIIIDPFYSTTTTPIPDIAIMCFKRDRQTAEKLYRAKRSLIAPIPINN